MPAHGIQKDYRNENAFFNKLKMAPQGTPGAAAIGSLFIAGPGGKKLAATSQDHASGGLQKRDHSMPGFLGSHYSGAAHASNGVKYSGRMPHGPAKGSGYLHYDQQHVYHSQGMTLAHPPRQTKKRTLNITESC